MDLFTISFVMGLCLAVLHLVVASASEDKAYGQARLPFVIHGRRGFFNIINATALSGFLITFGGLGVIFVQMEWQQQTVWLVAFTIATFVGIFLIKAMYALKIKALESGQSITDAIGLLAIVNKPIEIGTVGSIQYQMNGQAMSAPAISFNGKQIAVGSDVAIVALNDQVFVVSTIEKATNLR